MKVENSNELLLQALKQRQGGQDKSSSVSKNSVASSDSIDLTKPVRIGQTVVYVSLSKSLSLDGNSFKSGAATGTTASDASTSEDSDTVEPTADNPLGFNFKKVAKNVLGFVTGAIRRAQADGADEKKLNDLLGQARKGIDQGFGDARDELKGMGLFSEDLDKGITKSYDLIQDGLKKFEEELFGSKEDSAVGQDAATTTPTTTQTDSSNQSTANQNISVIGLAAAVSNRQSASLQLTTKEGDKVSISFDQQDLWRMQQGKTSANRKALEAYGDNSGGAGKSEYAASRTQSGSSAYYSHSVGFSFSVDGNLSQDELKAIGGLVDQIGSLSDSFFGGNIDSALEQAKNLSWDDNQLASFSLDMKQSQSAAVAASVDTSQTADKSAASDQTASSSDTGQTTSSLPDLSQIFGPFADYLDRLQSMIKEANTLFDKQGQDQLASWVVGQQQEGDNQQIAQKSDSFISFNDRMHKALQALSSLS